MGDLRAAVAAGTVSEVRVADGLPEGLCATGGSGSATAYLCWGDGAGHWTTRSGTRRR